VNRSTTRLLAAAAIIAVTSTAAIVPALSLAGSGSAHSTAVTPKRGEINLFADGISNSRSRTTVTGVIGDFGYGVTQDKNGKVDPNGDYEKVVLSQGTFIVNEAKLDASLRKHAKVQINHSNCSFYFFGSGTATLGSGTGAYTGITGRVTITLNIADIAHRKGTSCNLSGQPKGTFGTATGHGTISFK
jgi:hypothetical protein